MSARKKVAIIGSGCSGIGALWALKSTDHEVHLYETADRLGGHTNTVPFRHGGKRTAVDTGFIVLNTATYPNFIAFLKAIGVPTISTEMTFGVSRDKGLFEWSGTSLSAVFAQRSNLLNPDMWIMLFDIVRFNQFALDLLTDEGESEQDPSCCGSEASEPNKPSHPKSIGAYLDQNNYSEAFRTNYLIPMTAAVWSTAPDKVSLEFPAITLIRFMWNHHLLSTVASRPQWMTISGGSQQYIDAVMADFPREHVHMGEGVKSVSNVKDGRVRILLSSGKEDHYDHVIMATHGDQTLDILRETASGEEREILSGFKFSANLAVLHSDLSLMPLRPEAWSSWNYITTSPYITDQVSSVCLTYWMNLLQHIPSSKFGDVLVTLNPLTQPDPSKVQGSWTYHHPIYNDAAIRSQKQLPKIQNMRGISYAGAWTKYGFHEDGFSSGVKVAIEHLGAKLPFTFVDSTFSRGRKPKLGWLDLVMRLFICVIDIILKTLGCRQGSLTGHTGHTAAKRKGQ